MVCVIIGPAFVVLVVLLTAGVVAVAYIVGLPHYWEKSKLLTCSLVALGNYLLLNIVFHYCRAFFLGPGHPPERALVKQVRCSTMLYYHLYWMSKTCTN